MKEGFEPVSPPAKGAFFTLPLFYQQVSRPIFPLPSPFFHWLFDSFSTLSVDIRMIPSRRSASIWTTVYSAPVMSRLLLIIFSPVLWAIPVVSEAEIYQWKDASGIVHFSDAPREGASVIPPREATIYQSTTPKPVTLNISDTSVTFVYYDIYPSSRRDLNRAAFASTPIRANGKPFLGNASWNVKWNYKTWVSNGECWIKSVDTKVSITYTMPRLGNRNTLPQDVIQTFDRYYARLFLHEQGHGNHGNLAAKEVEELLLRIPRQKSCGALGPIANMRFKGVLAKYRDLDRQYDHETGHGRTQGADIASYSR